MGVVVVPSGWWGSSGADGVALEPREDPSPGWSAADAVFEPADQGPEPGTDPIADVLAGPLAARGLGGRVGTTVVDLTSGETVFAEGADVAQMPASTTKLLTTAAALAELGPDHRFTTAVTAIEPLTDGVTLTLVGGGDPLLGTTDGSVVTDLADLADATAAALTEAGVASVALAYDATMFTGPAVDPDWEPGYLPGGIVAPIEALMIDAARLDPEAGGDSGARADDPAEHAAQEFADLLADAGIDVTAGPTADAADPAGSEVATIRSAPLSSIVEYTLTSSHDEAAEILTRHVALARGLPGTSDDGSSAVLAALADLGIDVSEVTLADGSGLARGNRIPATTLGAVLATAASADHPRLRPVITGLPVAGFTGTLAQRWTADAPPGAGEIRAKTGTLTGTSSLAGVIETSGRATVAFAIIADDVTDTIAARAALDDVAGALYTCGCALP